MMGKFITIEGSDGSGKTTQINLLEKYFIDRGFDVIVTREPGGTEISEQIRNILLDSNNNKMMPLTEVFLYVAARVQHFKEKISPSITEGKIVICDRFVDSSVAYQGFGRNLGLKFIEDINYNAINGVKPDLTLFLYVEPSVGIERKKNQKTLDRMEQEKLEFHQRVYNGYEELLTLYPERIKKIDAHSSINNVFDKIIKEVENII